MPWRQARASELGQSRLLVARALRSRSWPLALTAQLGRGRPRPLWLLLIPNQMIRAWSRLRTTQGSLRTTARRRSRRSAGRLHPADVVRIEDPDYPEALRSIPSPPKTLWVRGTLPPVASVAIVGTRRPTTFG